MPILTMTASLLGVFVIDVHHWLGNCFAVGDPGFPDVRLHSELTQQAVHQHIQMQLSHAGDDRLSGILILSDFEGRVFFSQLD